MFREPSWIGNTLQGCGCNDNKASAQMRTGNPENGLLFNDNPLITVGVKFSRNELLNLALFVSGGVLLGTILGNKIAK